MPFKPGQSGNPAGRPPGSLSWNDALRRALNRSWRSGEPITAGERRTQMDRVARAMVEQAARGNVAAAAWLADRTEGKATQHLTVEGESTVHVVPWLPAVRTAQGDIVTTAPGSLTSSSAGGPLQEEDDAQGDPVSRDGGTRAQEEAQHGGVQEAEVVTWGDQAAPQQPTMLRPRGER